jgi:branched-chain amino acid transport system substrate-binding protein
MCRLALVAGLLCAAFASFAQDLESSPSVITIGVIVPLSGDMAFAGQEMRNAMTLALDEFETRTSRAHHKYRLLFEDNRLDAKLSVAAAQKLVGIDKAEVIVTLWPPTALVVLPITESRGVLHYTIAWDPSLAQQHKLLLSHQVMVDEIVRSTFRLLQRKKVARLAFIHMEESGFNIGARFAHSLAKEFGITLVADESYLAGEKDFKGIIARAGKEAPDGFLIWGVMPEIEMVIRQLKELKIKAFVTGYFDYVQDPNLIEGAEYVSEMYSTELFRTTYAARYKTHPVAKAPNAYDIMRLLIQAYERLGGTSKKPSAAEIKRYLTTIRDFPGAVGTVQIDHYGNSSYPPVIRRVVGAERQLQGVELGR